MSHGRDGVLKIHKIVSGFIWKAPKFKLLLSQIMYFFPLTGKSWINFTIFWKGTPSFSKKNVSNKLKSLNMKYFSKIYLCWLWNSLLLASKYYVFYSHFEYNFVHLRFKVHPSQFCYANLLWAGEGVLIGIFLHLAI